MPDGISFSDYLNSMVGMEKAKEILNMTQKEKAKQLIVISGQQGRTGKSTLKKLLRKHGYQVLESFECIEVILSEEIQHLVPEFTCLVD